MVSRFTFFISIALIFALLASPVSAFGAGNIASIARVEGKNFRHGDIEDILKTLPFLKGGKWTNSLIRRVYFGNWLRDYSQAIDVGTVQSVQANTIRILVWVLSLLSFGYATAEFEVTEERLGVYRPEEHIDNPKDYADNLDARLYDSRLRPPVRPLEIAVDPITGMKNYIANEHIGIATSAGYIKHSLNRSIHFGRLYTSGPQGEVNKEANLCEALRCLGQALHTLEDFTAHSNYVELVLREMGMLAVFPHVGLATQMTLPNGRLAFPLVTGTFGGVDFLHSVLGEAQDKFTQSELEEMDLALGEAHQENKKSGNKHAQTSLLKDLLSQIPGAGGLAADAEKIEAASDAKEFSNMKIAQPHEFGSKAATGSKGGFDPVKLSQDIMPILQFRDTVMRTIETTIESIPGLADLMETVSDTLSIYCFSVLAPYIRPIIAQANNELKVGSSAVVESAAKHQLEPWLNPHSTDPTHSMLSKDHFSNILNPPAGLVATEIVKYVVPRVLHCWENVSLDINAMLADVIQVLHHPGLRHPGSQIQMTMFDTVTKWAEAYPGGRAKLELELSSESVKAGKNHKGGFSASCGHGKLKGGEWDKQAKKKSKKDDKGGKKKKDEGMNIGGYQVPGGFPGGNALGGALTGALGGNLGGIISAGIAGYSGAPEPKKDKKDDKYDKYDKEKDKKKDKKYKDDGDKKRDDKKDKYKDKYEEDEDRKKKDKKDKDKDKDKDYKKDKKEKDKKDKYYGGRDEDEYSGDERRYGSHSDKKYYDHSSSYDKHKRASSKDRGKHHHHYEYDSHHRDDHTRHRSHSRHHSRSSSRSRPHSPRHEVEIYSGGGGGHHYHRDDEKYEYDYEYSRRQFSPPPHHTIGPYGLPDPYRRPLSVEHEHRSRSRSRSRHQRIEHHSNHSIGHYQQYEIDDEVVEVVEFAVQVPVPPPPPPGWSSGGTGYGSPPLQYYEGEANIVKAKKKRGDGQPYYYDGELYYGD